MMTEITIIIVCTGFFPMECRVCLNKIFIPEI